MAIIVGVGTQIRGKIGNMIYQVINGAQIIKSYAIPSNPQTDDQQDNRTVFQEVVDQFKGLATTWIKYFWNPFTVKNQTGWGNFISANLLSMGKVLFDLENAVLSRGSLEGLVSPAASYNDSTGLVVITWTKDVDNNGSTEDFVEGWVVVKVDGKYFLIPVDDTIRDDETVSISIDTGLTYDDVLVFLTVHQYRTTALSVGMVSDSQMVICSEDA